MASDIYQCIRTLQEGVFCTHALVDGLRGRRCHRVDMTQGDFGVGVLPVAIAMFMHWCSFFIVIGRFVPNYCSNCS